jgi:aminomethyltransferase
MADRDTATLRETPLHAFHERHGARLVPFAGWDMPVSYPAGTVAEHTHTRTHASIFDVAHMGAVELRGDGAAEALERLTPAGVANLAPGRQRYALLTNDVGGIEDDVMVANTGDALLMIVNASRRDHDLALLRRGLPGIEAVERLDLGLLALQGPEAEAVLAADDPSAAAMRFMDARHVTVAGVEVWASRSGYTGEDGFELLVPADRMETVAERLLSDERVELAGLGARDTLRLEAGLCLYGNDLDAATTPVEAGLVWTIPKRRREDADGYPGAARIAAEIADGPSRVRVGLRPQGRKPVRAGATLRDGASGETVGVVTSGGWSPSTGGPVAMGYVAPDHAATGRDLVADVRGRDVPATIADLPFVPHGYRR